MRKGEVPSILLVDDDVHHARIYGRVITRAGVRVIEASSGTDALEIARTTPLVGAVLDYSLPRSSGAEIAKAIKVACPTLPILFFSAALWLPEDAKAYAWGFVSKGHPEKLIATVKQLVREAVAKQAIRSAFGAAV